MEKYEPVRDIGSGHFGFAKLMRHRETRELVAVKCIDHGHRIDENVFREIINHRSLRHPNIIRFKEARYFFQQLISGVSYCHFMQICHRDLKLENTLLDGSPAPRVKICDFGYSKSSLLQSMAKSAVGTPAYIAPEVLFGPGEYDGKQADVWSCGVTLYVMLVGAYPFEDPKDPKNFRKTINNKSSSIQNTGLCAHIPGLQAPHLSHFRGKSTQEGNNKGDKDPPLVPEEPAKELKEEAQAVYYRRDGAAPAYSLQSIQEISRIVQEARALSRPSRPLREYGWNEINSDDEEKFESDNDNDDEEEDHDEDEYDKTVRAVHASGEFDMSDLYI
uniref:non-specific serine/threonine protein kinase n=1 Tax=Ananas comosus var. bracteatus TaxID=296719 RepID=A0A6V7Q6Z9_ANACO|nr:unnamed protein product [Ananas comosus var. bracteatus]